MLNIADSNVSKYFYDPAIVKQNKNPWEGTPVKAYYDLLPNQKGSASEKIVIKLLEEKGYTVKRRTNSGHDFIINNRKIELKFGLATERNTKYETIYNHISIDKDWDDILFVCINGDGNIKSACFSKETFPLTYANYQQGGVTVQNDDFMIAGARAAALLDDEHATHLL